MLGIVLVGLAVVPVGAVVALFLDKRPRLASVLWAGGVVAGSTVGMVGAFLALVTGVTESVSAPWSVPGGSFSLRLDPLSAFFLLPILGLPALAAVYGHGYLAEEKRPLGLHRLSYAGLVVGMGITVVAANGVLFLMAWEVMSVAAFFLVTFHHEKAAVRAAGWTYLVATHAGTAFLLFFFAWMGRDAGSLDFADFQPPAGAVVPFLLALVGFGAKAGFVPLHVWLPEAHPAAPSHVSAVMSGVMIKTGIYGLLRAITLLLGPEGAPPAWWGWTLVAVGASSGVLGILSALGQRDLKRLLAYSSVENVGVIALGIGVGLLGLSADRPLVAALGFGGALFHVANHACMKGLLFLGAGSVLHAKGHVDLERLGGLIKSMPWTAAAFLMGSAAICALPPLNGLVGELLIYLGAYRGTGGLAFDGGLVAFTVTIAALALIGGLAAASFSKACGVAFLGSPRQEEAVGGEEAGRAMRVPMALLAGACLLLGLAAPWLLRLLQGPLRCLGMTDSADALDYARGTLAPVTGLSLLLIALAGAFALLRRLLLRARVVATGPTWDCGYARPGARMQYTASSFTDSLRATFGPLAPVREEVLPPSGFFPARASFASGTPDLATEKLFRPVFSRVVSLLASLHWLQRGAVQRYVLYVGLTALVLLVWRVVR